MFSKWLSILIYVLAIALSSFCFGYAQKREAVNKYTFILASALGMIILILPLSFRTCGVDYQSYVDIFNNAPKSIVDYVTNYKRYYEPLYSILMILSQKLTDNPRIVNVLCAVITVPLYYGGIIRLRDKIDLGKTTFLLGMMSYLYMFGLNRICIALALVSWATKDLLDEKTLKYLVIILLAIGFHYSAIIMLPVYFIIKYTKGIKNYQYVIGMVIIVVVGMLVLKKLMPLLSEHIFFWNRYMVYVGNRVQLTIFGDDAINIALWGFLIVTIFKRELWIDEENKLVKLSLTAFSIMCAATVIAFHRLAYYFYPIEAILYYLIEMKIKEGKIKIPHIKTSALVIIYDVGMIIMCLIWLYNFLIRRDCWAPFLVPYTFV